MIEFVFSAAVPPTTVPAQILRQSWFEWHFAKKSTFWAKFLIITVIFGSNLNTTAAKNPGRKLEQCHSICASTVQLTETSWVELYTQHCCCVIGDRYHSGLERLIKSEAKFLRNIALFCQNLPNQRHGQKRWGHIIMKVDGGHPIEVVLILILLLRL